MKRLSIYFLIFLLTFLLALSLVSAGSLTTSNHATYNILYDDPNHNVQYSIVNGQVQIDIYTDNDVSYGVYTDDLTKNTGKNNKTHDKHGKVKPIKDKNELVKNSKNTIFYKPTKKSQVIYIGEASEVVEVVNESKVIYTENNGLVYNTTLLRCQAEGINCTIQPHDVEIVSNGPSNYKFGAYDSGVNSGSSWYQYRVISNYPLIQKNNNLWTARFDSYTIKTDLGTTKYYTDYDIDFSGASAYDTDELNTTQGNKTYTYTETRNYYNITDPETSTIQETYHVTQSELIVTFYSNGSIDPSITQSTSSIAVEGIAIHNQTRHSPSDNDITLNRSTIGETLIVQPLDLQGNFTIQNVSINTYQDVSGNDSLQLLLRMEEGSGSVTMDESGYNRNGTITTATYTTERQLGDYAIKLLGATNENIVTTGYQGVTGTSARTLLAWIKTNHTSSIQTIIGYGTMPAQSKIDFNVEAPDRMFVRVQSGSKAFNAIGIQDGAWHMVTLTLPQNGLISEFHMTMDGVNLTENTSGGASAVNTGLADLEIGSSPVSNQFFNGSIDTVAIWNKTLTLGEIQRIYNATRTGYDNSLANVTTFYRLSTGTNDSIDYSYNSTNISLFFSINNVTLGSNTTHIKDESVNSNDALYVGSLTDGFVNTGFEFNGGTNNINVTDDATITDIWSAGGTISFWMKPNNAGAGGFGRIFNKGNTAIDIRNLGDLQFNFYIPFSGTDGNWRSDTGQLTTGVWTHVVMTYDASSTSNNPSIYFNGELADGSIILTPTGTVDSDTGNNMYIGNREDLIRGFNGTMDEIYFLKRIVTASEIKGLYESQALNYGPWTKELNGTNSTGRLLQYQLNFTSNDQLYSEYVSNITFGYEEISFSSGGPPPPDTDPPTILILLPTNGTQVDNGTNTRVNITANVTDANTVSNVNVTITQSNGSQVFLDMTNFATPTYNTSFFLNQGPLGRYNFTIFAVDNNSNEATATGWFNVTNSTVPPAPASSTEINVTLTSPVNNTNVTTLTPTFSWVYSHGAGVAGNCTLFVNNTQGGDTACLSGSTTNLVVNHTLGNYTNYTWFVRATAGANETNSSVFNFRVEVLTTPATAQSTTSITQALYLFLIGMIILITGLTFKNITIGLFGGVYLLVLGTYFLANPVTSLGPMANLALGVVLFGLGGYVWVVGALEYIDENQTLIGG